MVIGAEPRTRSQVRELRKDELVTLVMQRSQLVEEQAEVIRELQLKVESLSASAASSPSATRTAQITAPAVTCPTASRYGTTAPL